MECQMTGLAGTGWFRRYVRTDRPVRKNQHPCVDLREGVYGGTGRIASGSTRLRIACLHYFLQKFQVLAICPAHGHCHERCKDGREACRFSAVSQRHACKSVRDTFPRIAGFHGKWPLRSAHHKALTGDVCDNFVGVLEPSSQKLRNERDPGTGGCRWRCLPFDRLDVHIPRRCIVRISGIGSDFSPCAIDLDTG